MNVLNRNNMWMKSIFVKSLWFLNWFWLGGSGIIWSQVTFTHGPLVGAVTAESARILARTDKQATVRFELDTDSTFANPIITSAVIAEPDSDFFFSIYVNGLTPNSKYYYRAVINDLPHSDVASFMTFPPVGTITEFTFAFGACQQANGDPNSNIGRVFPLIAQDEPRFFLQLGDWTYPDTTDTPENPNNFFNIDYVRVRDSYKAKYDPTYPMNELFKIAPIDYVYDDHDYSNNNSDMSFPGRENSLRGYKAMFPHYPLANPKHGLWHKFTFGNTDFFMLDTRTQRHPNILGFQQDSNNKYFFQPGPEHLILQGEATITGEMQMDWLIRELQESTATWKFICTSVPFNPGHRALIELALLFQGSDFDPIPTPNGLLTAASLAFLVSDSWNGFPASVQRLVKAVNEAKVRNVIVLSGDSHTAAIDDGANALFPEIMAGGLDRSNSSLVAIAELLGIQVWNRGGQTLARKNYNSHFGRITVFGSDSVQMELVDEFGDLIASYTQTNGHLVSKVALTYVAESQNFGDVSIDTTSKLSILFMSTGTDTVVVKNITSSRPEFVVKPENFMIPPGKRVDGQILFQPQVLGNLQATLTIESNDPESPFFIHIQGNGVQPTVVEDEFILPPSRYALEQNYPNPFNADTRVPYELAQDSEVTLRIFNLRGQEVRTFKFLNQKSGCYHVDWDGCNHAGRKVATGVYIYRLEATPTAGGKKFVQSKKMILLQ